MAQATLLEMCNTIAAQMRMPQLRSVIGNSDRNAIAIYTALKKGIERDVIRSNQWDEMVVDAEIIGNGLNYPYALPLDFDHLVNGTFWDVNNNCPAAGPLDPYQWSALINSETTVSARPMNFRFLSYNFSKIPQFPGVGRRPALEFYPLLPAQVIAIEGGSSTRFRYSYMSKWYVLDGGTFAPKEKFSSDGDTTVVDTEMMEQAGYTRMLRSVGLAFQSEQDELMAMISERRQKDGGMTRINMAGRGPVPRPNLGPDYATFRSGRRWR